MKTHRRSFDDDIIVGTNLPDLILAYGGDDIISGEKGNDCMDEDDLIKWIRSGRE